MLAQRFKWERNTDVKVSVYPQILLLFCLFFFGPSLYFLLYFVLSYVLALWRLRNLSFGKLFLQTITNFMKPWKQLVCCQWFGLSRFGVRLQVGMWLKFCYTEELCGGGKKALYSSPSLFAILLLGTNAFHWRDLLLANTWEPWNKLLGFNDRHIYWYISSSSWSL